MSQQQPRKRGANYTQEEKSLLLDLVMQVKHIVECKRTGGKFIEKKREAWNAITMKYNSNCTSDPRDMDQLKSLYDNMKQKSRKDVGESNKLAYIDAELNCMVTQEDVAHAIQTIKEDKVLCALSFLASGSYQKIVSVGQYLTQRTTSRCIREVVNALNHNCMISRWIVFPETPHQRSLIKEKFQRTYNLPGVIGCIDCTHITITRPVEEEHMFFNRKGLSFLKCSNGKPLDKF